MANNLKKVSYLTNISPVSMTGTDLFYLVHSTGGVTTSYSLQLSDLFLGTNNLTTSIKFNNNSLFVKSGKVGINKEPTVALDVVGDFAVTSNVTIGTSATIANRLVDAFPSGTRLMFAQSTAPTGWTQDTTDTSTNRMLRVVNSAGGGIGGTHSPILNNVVAAHTHGFTTGTESSDHSHSGWTGGTSANHNHAYIDTYFNMYGGGSYGSNSAHDYDNEFQDHNKTTGWQSNDHAHYITTGGISAAHTHSGSTDNGSSSTNWQPRYIDMILCVKN